MATNFKTPSVAANTASLDGDSLSAAPPVNMSSKEKHYAYLKERYGLDYQKREPTRLGDDPEIGANSPKSGIARRMDSKDVEHVEVLSHCPLLSCVSRQNYQQLRKKSPRLDSNTFSTITIRF
mmetsp:Transcript_25683/g.41249  ORF Transcript_25683/g.41249 Transcript_25683/m.41249 type:complete len:123 (+) Transcript_25683:28-396(+)